MNIIEALKSNEYYLTLQVASNQKRWMYWDNISGYWVVKESGRGGAQWIAQTRSEEEAIRNLLGLPIMMEAGEPSPVSHSQTSGEAK